ncbi:MAG: Na+/H+ antiporter NhaC family protein [Clostridia bacterium]|nr:Na+/H+ antiporter NhaC family protein [Clostridia bacterium]
MEFGWLSLLPPIIAIGLAITTKEVYSSLFIGIFSGALIYTNFNIVNAFTTSFDIIINKAGDSWNMAILIFLGLLGGLIAIVTAAGGSKSYGEWASKKVKTRAGAQLATALLGLIIFIDDYFNSLTVGTVMKPVTDRYRISRAKLAYLLDCTAAPICIIAPISSWAAAVVANINESAEGLNGFNIFMQSIPYNLYAWLTIIMVVYIALTNLEYGPMAKFEKRAIEKGQLQEERDAVTPGDDLDNIKVSDKGKTLDLIIPILGLIVFSIIGMLYTGGYFEGSKTIAQAFGDTDAATSLVYGGFLAILLTLVLFIPRRIMTFGDFMNSFVEGIKSMVPAFTILMLAWAIGGVCGSDYLNTGGFVATAVGDSIPAWVLPTILFVIAGFIGFSTGTSWGTFGILLPIAIPIALQTNPEILVPVVSSVLAGAVYGDHCSPISDTTILSSTGASCHHLDHVATQLPYATTVAIVSAIGYIIAGVTQNAVLTLVFSVALLLIVLFTLNRLYTIKQKHLSKAELDS